tara:strand:- start:548 stop:1261 length:714 start_codon:yes stop_codon:yes gene_type:complete
MKTPLLSVEDLYLELGDTNQKVKILKGMNFIIEKGEKVSVVGPSGSGKTSLLMALSGLVKPTSGDIYIEGQALSPMSEDELAALRLQHVGIVFQNFHLIPSLNAMQNVAFPAELRGDADAQEKAKEWLEKVGLGHRLTHKPTQLSGGEQQRVALARAMITSPSLLMADEPTGNLDRKTGETITQLLFELSETHGVALILVTHDEALAATCERTLVIHDGLIEKDLVNKASKKAAKKA